jgi:hypothetical protein
MPASALGLSKLMGALGFKQSEGLRFVETIQPVLTVGDASAWANVPEVPCAIWGTTNDVAAGGHDSMQVYAHAPGGLWIDNIAFNSANPVVLTVSLFLVDFTAAAGLPLTTPVPLVPLTCSQPTAGPITTTGESGFNPLGAFVATSSPGMVCNTLQGPTGPLNGVYVPHGSVFGLRGETGAELNSWMRVRELQEVPEVR